MDLQLDGRRAIVSGSTQGIGYAVARALAAEGAHVVLHGRSERRVEAAVARLRGEGLRGEVTGVVIDFADDRAADAVADLADADILINNVGIFDVQAFDTVPDADWYRFFTVNVMSAVRLSRQLLPGMLANGWGRIVFMASESGVDVPGNMIHYGVSKAALLALSNGLAKLTRGTQVTVNSVVGGPTYSDGVAAAVRSLADSEGLSEGELKAMIAGQNTTSLVQRFLEPAELADLTAFLASPLSSATNGSALRADGGTLVQVL